MRIGKAILLVSIVLLLVVGLWLYWTLTNHGFSRRERPRTIGAFLARKARGLATPAEVKSLKNPLPSTPLSIAGSVPHMLILRKPPGHSHRKRVRAKKSRLVTEKSRGQKQRVG